MPKRKAATEEDVSDGSDISQRKEKTAQTTKVLHSAEGWATFINFKLLQETHSTNERI